MNGTRICDSYAQQKSFCVTKRKLEPPIRKWMYLELGEININVILCLVRETENTCKQ